MRLDPELARTQAFGMQTIKREAEDLETEVASNAHYLIAVLVVERRRAQSVTETVVLIPCSKWSMSSPSGVCATMRHVKL